MAEKLSSPRLLKTHLPAQLAPKEIFSLNRKTVTVIRNPKDVALSIRKFYQNGTCLEPFNKFENLEDFLDHFLGGKTFYGSWWDWNRAWVDKSRLAEKNNWSNFSARTKKKLPYYIKVLEDCYQYV